MLDRCFHGTHSYKTLSTVLTLMYFQCMQFVFSSEPENSCQRLNSNLKQNRSEKEYFYSHFFSHISVVFYTTITNHMSLISILINITEKKVDWKICQGKTRDKYNFNFYVRLTLYKFILLRCGLNLSVTTRAITCVHTPRKYQKWLPRRDVDGREMSRML